ncbi:hypothetical protein CDCA_CDCA05G1718 [Cyanidium caldarium]|uniref:U3 small nucleolar RNA-associated protein 13 C-terminal domain-containing protein n=1 Tax=Cyanidium caldarium TaxID=2771 RepID=A0AAV9ITT4_CYACA|nr:hypothetical protein CDCA_CDCA05G1718 [Cyanidium caldarium]
MPPGRRSYEAVQGGSALYTGGRVVSGREVRNGAVHRFLVAPCGAHCTVLAVNESGVDEAVENESGMDRRRTPSTTATGASCPAFPLAILTSDEDVDVEEEQQVTSVCVSPDGSLVFYATRSGRGYLFAEWYPQRSTAAHPDEAVDAATAAAGSPDRAPRTRPRWAFLPFESSRRVVVDCCFDASSTLLACASATGDVRVFDARQRYVTHVIRPAGAPGIATCVVFRQGDAFMREAGRRQQSSSPPTSKRARHRRDARQLKAAVAAEADTSSTTSAAHPERSLQLWVGFESGAIAQYDLHRKRWCGQTQHHDGAVLCMVAIPDDGDDDLHSTASRLVSAGMDALLIVWDAQQLRPLYTVMAGAPLTCMASLNWLPDGAYRLALGTAGGTMQVLEVVSGDAPRIHHTGVQVSSGAAAVIEVDRCGERKLPAAADSEAVAVVSVAPLERAGAAENLVVMATADQMLHTIRVADRTPGAPSPPRLEVIHTLVGNLDQVYDMQCVDGCATADHWDVAVASNLHAIPVFRLETAGRPRLAPSSSSSSSFFVCHRNLVGHTDAVLALAQVPPLAPSPAATSAATPAAVHLASASKDRTVRLWNVGRGVEVAVGTGHTASVQAVCCNWGRRPSPSSRPALVVVSGDDDGTLKWWTRSTERAARTHSATAVRDARGGAVLPSFPCAVTIGRAHSDEVHALAFAPDAQWVASGSRDRTVKLWRVADVLALTSPTALPAPHAILTGHRRAVWSVCFSPSEPRLLASASSDRTIRLWSVHDGSCVRMLQSAGGRSREAGSLLRCLFIGGGGGGAQVVSASSDGSVSVWHAGTGEWAGELVAPPDGEGERTNLSVVALETSGRAHDDRVWALTTVPSVSATDREEAGAYLLTGGADGRVWLWRDVTAEQVERAAQQRDALLLREQSLQNALQRGRWREALVGALEMDRPSRAYAAVEAVIARAAGSVEETEPEEVLVAWILQLSSSSSSPMSLWRLLQYVCEWNAQARTAAVAQRVLRALFRAYHPPARLRAQLCQAGDALPGRVRGEQVRALAVALHAHTQRHTTRAQRLWDELRLLDYVVERRSGALGNGDDGLQPDGMEESTRNGGQDGRKWPGNGEIR